MTIDSIAYHVQQDLLKLNVNVKESDLKAILEKYLKKDIVQPMRLGNTIYNPELQLFGDKRLSAKENAILLILAQHLGQTVERPFLLQHVWGEVDYFNSRSLAVFINHLRKILASDTALEILSMHGIGYKLIQR